MLVMAMALAIPVDQPEPALVEELAQARRRDRPEVRVGEVGEGEHRALIASVALLYEFPINIPAANTSAPPTMIWNAAEKNGVSM